MSTYYVRKNGNDTTGNGSLTTPYLTIAKANTVATNGDTINIGDGIFTETLVIGAISNVLYQGAGLSRTIILGNPTNSKTNILLWNDLRINLISYTSYELASNGGNISHVFLDGTNAGTANVNVFKCGSSKTLVFRNCIFYNLIGGGVLNSSSSGAIINIISLSITKLYNCVIYGTSGSVFSHNYTINSTTLIIRNCIIHHNYYLDSTTADMYINNANKEYNTFYDFRTWGQGLLLGTGEMNTDPIFVDAAGGDFRLQSTSPCIGKGTSNLP